MSGLNLQHKDTNENPFDKQEEETIYVECEEKSNDRSSERLRSSVITNLNS